jgi:pimeloyl-ACP methyl ester carboxylesterase
VNVSVSGTRFADRFVEVVNPAEDAITIRAAVKGDGDQVIVCVHGWPELWYSWRHQLEHFGAPGSGYTVVAIDVRGYGGSSAPHAIADYTLTRICGDVAAVIDELGGGRPAIVLGHDWGAPIAWNTARLHPGRVSAVCGLSVPYFPITEDNPIDRWRALYTDQGKFFYQVYFQDEGVAEAELGADTLTSIRKIYYSASGDAHTTGRGADFAREKPADAAMLDGLIDPDPFPAWCSAEDLRVFAEGIDAKGWRGPINRYRAQPLDATEIGPMPDPNLHQPAAFIGGEFDVVRGFASGVDPYDFAHLACDDFRGTTIVPGAGHWVQQEAPAATNAALEAFFASL